MDRQTQAGKNITSLCRGNKALKIFLKVCIYGLLYFNALNKSGLDRLDYHRDLITENLFREIKDPKHPLHYLLPAVKVSHSQMLLRPTYPYQLPVSKATCCGRDFVPYCISKKF